MGQSRIKNTYKNIVYAVIFQIIKIALVFISRMVFVKKLGAAYLGVEGLFSNILSILSLADLGMTTALMYSLYKPLAEKDEIKISQYMNYYKKIYLIIACIVGIVGIVLIPFLKYLVNLPTEMEHIYLYYILILTNSVISYLFVYKTTLLSADQKMYVINKYDTVFQFILFFLRLGILLFTNSFTLYLIVNILCTFISNLLKAKATNKEYPFLNKNKKEKLNKNEKKNLFENVYSLFFYKLGGVIQSNTDNILISIFVGTITVGYYSNYSLIITSIITFITLIFNSIKSSVGNYVVAKNIKDQFELFNILEVFNFWLICFCSICFIILIPNFIEIFFGKEYVLDLIFLIFLVLNFYTNNIRQTIWMFRETSGVFKQTKYITLVTAMINIVTSLIFGYLYGLIGIVGATVLSRMIYAWWKEPLIIYRKYFKKSPISYFKNYIIRLIITSIICLIIYEICMVIPEINIYINFIIKMIICVVLIPLILFVTYRKNYAYIYFRDILLKKKGKSN